MLNKSLFACSAILFVLSAPAMAGSVQIGYSVTGLGGNVFQYNYSVFDNGAGFPVQLFDIDFNTSLYLESSLTPVTGPPLSSQWSEMILHSAPGFPAEYDVLATAGGIANGATVSAFEVRFTWLGQGLPGAQAFEIFDPSTFQLLQSGTTAAGAPEPSFLGLIGLAVVYGGWKLRRVR